MTNITMQSLMTDNGASEAPLSCWTIGLLSYSNNRTLALDELESKHKNNFTSHRIPYHNSGSQSGPTMKLLQQNEGVMGIMLTKPQKNRSSGFLIIRVQRTQIRVQRTFLII